MTIQSPISPKVVLWLCVPVFVTFWTSTSEGALAIALSGDVDLVSSNLAAQESGLSDDENEDLESGHDGLQCGPATVCCEAELVATIHAMFSPEPGVGRIFWVKSRVTASLSRPPPLVVPIAVN